MFKAYFCKPLPFKGAVRSLSCALACVAFMAAPALAHHGMTTKFDPERGETLRGTVSRVDWAFPHVHVFMVVEDDGESLPWYVELESPQLLELNGWNEDTLQPGQQIVVEGFRARDDSRQVWGESIVAGDNELFTLQYESLLDSITDVSHDATPRWPDNQVRLGAPPGRAGYWVPETTVLMEDGANVAMAPNGQLENIADAPKVAPLQTWALRLYETRQRNFLRSDPTYVECRPPAGPRKWLDPYGIQLLEDRPLERIFVIAGGGNHDWHLVYTDGRALDGEEFYLDAGNLLYYGRNTAAWDGDTLVIESNGYNEKFWLPGGLPHSDQMHATERLTRVDYGTLHYEITIDDPGTYTRPWSASWNLRWLEGNDPPEHYCQDNRL
ncbi:MAG: DUF6152 family protein [Gammaproteobacteria bacterium]